MLINRDQAERRGSKYMAGFTAKNRLVRAIAITGALAVGAAACGTDDGASVTNLAEGDGSVSASSGSGSGSSSASASASGPSEDDGGAVTVGDGGYEYVSDVDSHRLVVADICEVSDALPSDAEIDFDAVAAIYRDGGNSVNSDGSIRTVAGFASREDRNPELQEFFGTSTPLDDFVTSALEGTGDFEGEPDLVRRQGVQKGIQNATMVAWTIHEFNTALSKASEGDLEPAGGAPHNWDEAWAFYHGAEPGCSPFATANSQAGNFGTEGADGETAQANEIILQAMIEGRDALLAEDVAGAEAAVADTVRGLAITYSQASLRYAQLVENDLGEGDAETARIHQAEGLAFSRVLAPQLADAGADMDTVLATFALENEPAEGWYATIEEALAPAWDTLGIDRDADIGELS